MKKRFTEEQIIGFLRQAEAGMAVKELCRKHGFSEASYYLWRSKFGGMDVSDAKKLKALEVENANLIAQYNASDQLQRKFVHGAGMDAPLVWFEGTGEGNRKFLHADERGSIVAVSDNAGAAAASVKYSTDGEFSPALVSQFGYTGQVYIAALDLYYYKARMYSPKTGRFMQPDPISYAAGMNLYAYVSGDPINAVDPWGLSDCPRAVADELPCAVVRGERLRHCVVGGSYCSEFESLAPIPDYLSAATLVVPTVNFGPQSEKPQLCYKRLNDGSTIARNASTARMLGEIAFRDAAGDGSAAVGSLLFLGLKFSFGSWGKVLGEPDGNHNYGAVMRAYGFSRETSGRIAGAAEKAEGLILPRTGGGQSVGDVFGSPPYGDSPLGHAQVNEGWDAGC